MKASETSAGRDFHEIAISQISEGAKKTLIGKKSMKIGLIMQKLSLE